MPFPAGGIFIKQKAARWGEVIKKTGVAVD